MSYSKKKLGGVVELKYGKGIAKAERNAQGKYPVFGANGILGNTDKFLVEGEAIIVGRKGSVGEIKRASGKFWPSDVTYYVFGNEEIDIDYLYHFLKSANLQQFAAGVKPGLNRNRVYELEIPLPPLSEQKKIVKVLEEKLGKVKKATKLREDALADIEKILPARLTEIFAEGKNQGWEEKKLDDKSILKMTSGGTPNRSNVNFYQGDIPWLKSGELKDSTNITDSEEKISEEAIKKSSAKIFPSDTVLFAMYGATAGKIGILGAEASTNQAVAGMIPVREKLNSKYLYYFLIKKREEIISKAWGGAQPNLSQTIIKSFSIPLPDLKTQEKIVKELDALSARVAELRARQQEQLHDLKSLERAYLHEAFAGELITEEKEETLEKPVLSPIQIFPIQQAIGTTFEHGFERGEMPVAKVLYLAQELYDVPLGIPFTPQNFGPYDTNVKKALTAGLSKTNKYFKKKEFGYGLGEQSEKLLKYRNSKIVRQMHKALKELMPHIRYAKSSSIERLATVCKIIQDSKTTDEEKVIAEMRAWKEDKFTDDQIKKSLQFITSKGWDKKLLK